MFSFNIAFRLGSRRATKKQSRNLRIPPAAYQCVQSDCSGRSFSLGSITAARMSAWLSVRPHMKFLLLVGLAIGASTVSGCATVSTANDFYCPPTRVALSFAGVNTENCGFDHYQASLGERRTLAACVAKARAQGRPVAFGYIGHTPDSFMCTLGISRADRQFWSVEYVQDYSFPANDPRRGPTMFVGKCSSIEVAQSASGHPAPFTTAQCVDDEEAFGYFKKALARKMRPN